MKKIRFKNTKLKFRHKLVIAIISSLFLVIYFCIFLINSISTNLIEYVSSKVKKENIILLKNAFSEVDYRNIDLNKLINVIKNSKEEIVEVDFDIDECSKILTEVTKYINERVDHYNYTGYKIDVPVGFATRTPILINMGPKIPIKVELSDTALGNVRTIAKSFGINSALIEVYVDIYIKTSVIYPSQILTEDSQYSSLVTSKIIVGSVPNFYNGSFNSKSATLDLPLGQ